MYRRVMEAVGNNEFQAYLILNEGNRNYLCNKGNYFLPGVMLITEQEVYLATPSRNINYFTKIYNNYNVFAGGMPEIAEVCKKLKIDKLGYEATTISKLEYDMMHDLFGDITYVEGPQFIEDIRMIKTPEEIVLLQEAAALSDKAYLEFLNHLKIGMTEKKARATFDHILMSYGADEFSFPTLLSSGERSFMPHSAPTNKVIETGDLVLMDFGIVLNGYCSDTTRTVVMGTANDVQKDMYQLVLQSQNYALDHIVAGMTCKQADALSRDMITAKISKGCFDYGLGHGIGMQVHEKPRFHYNSDYVLPANCAMSVEPGLYIEGFGGIRIEDILIIGDKKGGRNLTKAPKDTLLEI